MTQEEINPAAFQSPSRLKQPTKGLHSFSSKLVPALNLNAVEGKIDAPSFGSLSGDETTDSPLGKKRRLSLRNQQKIQSTNKIGTNSVGQAVKAAPIPPKDGLLRTAASTQGKNVKGPISGSNLNASTNLIATSALKIGVRTNNVAPMKLEAATSSHHEGINSGNKRKRQVWDTKGRLEDAEYEIRELTVQMQDASQSLQDASSQLAIQEKKVAELEAQKTVLENQLAADAASRMTVAEEIQQLQDKLIAEKNSAHSTVMLLKKEHQEKITILEERLQCLQEKHDNTVVELNQVLVELDAYRKANESQNSAMSGLTAEAITMQTKIRSLENSQVLQEKALLSLQDNLVVKEKEIAALEAEVREAEMLRKKLHNEIQELKGNIRVFCRVRPILAQDGEIEAEGGNNHYTFNVDSKLNQHEITLHQKVMDHVTLKPTERLYPFSFDRVFAPSATQGQVFEDINGLVQSALDGYKVCIFAYGQTGSGKTHTMEGGGSLLFRDKLESTVPSSLDQTDDDSSMGMIPRALDQIFKTASEKSNRAGWTFSMEASFLEIYNEVLRDLLSSPNKHGNSNNNVSSTSSSSAFSSTHSSAQGTSSSMASGSGPLDIKHAPNGDTTVTGLTVVPVQSLQQVIKLLETASKNRAVGETQCNERSSRSHSVFTLKIIANNPITNERLAGQLHLIDLAGSERLASSGAVGDRLKETQAINKSLSALGDVIASLGNPESRHVPYRNSKLTYLLQNSLGGNSKTLMIVTLNPSSASIQESLCSLRFASKVNACSIGVAKRNLVKEN